MCGCGGVRMCGCVGVKVHVYMYQDYLHVKFSLFASWFVLTKIKNREITCAMRVGTCYHKM